MVEAHADAACGELSAGGTSRRRILVVDDHAIVRVGLRALLSSQPWVERCVTAADGAEAEELVERYEPHVALVDLFLGEEMGIELSRRLVARAPDVRIVLMSGTGRVSAAVGRAAGTMGFISKEWSAQATMEAVLRVAQGRTVFPSAATATPRTPLSVRETDVLHQIAAGASNTEAARALFLSPHTVKQHTSSIYRKLGVRKRAEAVRRAQTLGLLS